MVREGVHVVRAGEDEVEVGVHVVGGECDKLAPTPEHLTEEKGRISRVSEGDDEADGDIVVALVLVVEVEHARRARREVEVAEAAGEEDAS